MISGTNEVAPRLILYRDATGQGCMETVGAPMQAVDALGLLEWARLRLRSRDLVALLLAEGVIKCQ